MDQRVGRLEKRRRIREGEVEPSLLGLRETGAQLRDVDRDDASDTGILLEAGQHPATDRSRGAGDDHGAAVEIGAFAVEGLDDHPPTMPV